MFALVEGESVKIRKSSGCRAFDRHLMSDRLESSFTGLLSMGVTRVGFCANRVDRIDDFVGEPRSMSFQVRNKMVRVPVGYFCT